MRPDGLNQKAPYAASMWRVWITPLVVCAVLTGCGQTGALYLPQETDVIVTDGPPPSPPETTVAPP